MITITHKPVERVIVRGASRLVVVQAPYVLTSDSGQIVALVFVLDGGGLDIVAGATCDLEVPFDCDITGWTITADAAGSAVVDVRKADYATFPVLSSIAGTEKPTLSSAQKNQDLDLTTWTKPLAAGDILRAHAESVSGVKKITITVRATRS